MYYGLRSFVKVRERDRPREFLGFIVHKPLCVYEVDMPGYNGLTSNKRAVEHFRKKLAFLHKVKAKDVRSYLIVNVYKKFTKK
jgi:hypothetical protein